MYNKNNFVVVDDKTTVYNKINIDVFTRINVWFFNNDGSTDMFDDGIPDEVLDLIKERRLNAENCLQAVEAYYEGDSDLENYEYIYCIEIMDDYDEIAFAFDYD